MAAYESGSSYDFTGQRQMGPMLAKARRGLQFGMTAYSPYENPAERDARARELLAGYGEALGNISEAGARAGQSEWSRARSGEGRGSETSLPANQLRLMGLQERPATQYAPPPPPPAPSGFRPDYGNAPSQWSVGPGTKIEGWKPPADRKTTTTSQAPMALAGLKKSFMPESKYGTGINTYTGQVVNLDTHQGTQYSPGYNSPLPSTKGTTSGGGLQLYGDSGITYGAGSEEAYKKAMKGQLSSGWAGKAA